MEGATHPHTTALALGRCQEASVLSYHPQQGNVNHSVSAAQCWLSLWCSVLLSGKSSDTLAPVTYLAYHLLYLGCVGSSVKEYFQRTEPYFVLCKRTHSGERCYWWFRRHCIYNIKHTHIHTEQMLKLCKEVKFTKQTLWSLE